MKDRVCLTFWADEALAEIYKYKETDLHGHVVITDWRFPYEYSVLASSPFMDTVFRVRVIRPDNPPIEAGAQHSSETSLPDNDDEQYDKVFYNSSSIDDLKEKVAAWVKEIMSSRQVLEESTNHLSLK